MGIHKLMEILKRYASKSITKVDINYFNGKYNLIGQIKLM